MSIVDPCVLDLLKNSESRYTLVVECSKRARQIVSGAQPMVEGKDLKPLKAAVEEVNRGLLSYTTPAEENLAEE